MARKRQTLPKNFEELLKSGDLAAMKAIFDECEIDARGGYAKQTALAFVDCPDELTRWLVEQGADLGALDTWKNTPLHTRAKLRPSAVKVLIELGADVNSATATIGTPLHAAAHTVQVESARLLISGGAFVDAKNTAKMTPLEFALRHCHNTALDRMAEFARVLLEAGAKKTPVMNGLVEQLGKTFEFHRSGFNREFLDAVSAGLDRLYALLDVPPVPRRRMHDGVSRIEVTTRTWQEQHAELWTLLVPSSGAAKTVQGEVIRLAGRIADEWERNGGANWDTRYEQWANAFAHYVASGKALVPAELEEVEKIVRALKRRAGEGNDRLMRLAVVWVLENPEPVALERPDYDR